MQIERVTVEYVAAEDRIRLSAAVPGDGPVGLWLTRRLIVRLLPPLLQWLEQQTAHLPYAELAQAWAQGAALEALSPQPAVPPAGTERSWLVTEVDLVCNAESLVLRLRGASAHSAEISFCAQTLRQWLGILRDHCAQAEWPLDGWPEWIAGARAPAPPPRHLH